MWTGKRSAGRPVRRIIVTHFHPDHMGLADWLSQRWDAPLWTTEREWLHARMMSQDTAEASAALRSPARLACHRL